MKACPDCGLPMEWEGAPACGPCFSVRCEEQGMSESEKLSEMARIAEAEGVPQALAFLVMLTAAPLSEKERDEGNRRIRRRRGRLN